MMWRFQSYEAFPHLILQSLNHGYVFQVHGSIDSGRYGMPQAYWDKRQHVPRSTQTWKNFSDLFTVPKIATDK